MPFAPRIAFVDVETTGTSPAACHITEIGIVTVEGADQPDPAHWRVEEWSSLVNPGVPIPPEIRFLTGISDEMVADAPPFAALAPQILQRLEGALFIAHQARFDYGFVRAALARAGHAFGARTLCTVRLSRLIDPQRSPHTLDAIIARYRLPAADRHRALGDARVLWAFVQALTRRHGMLPLRQAASRLLQHPGLPAHLGVDALEAVPAACGVYVMLGQNDQPLYVGRSLNLRRRIASHFSTDPTRERAARLASETHRLQWRVTRGELGARLLESHWIKSRQPSHNIALRRTQPAFIEFPADQARPRILAADTRAPADCAGLIGPFASRAGARAALLQAADAAGLCLSSLGLERRPAGQPCFRRQLGRCAGACVQARPPLTDALLLAESLQAHRMPAWPFASAIALIEAADDGSGHDWHVFHQWRHLGTGASLEEARQLAAEPPAALEPDIYRLLRTELAGTGAQDDRIRLL